MILLLILISSYNIISLKKAYDTNYSLCHPSTEKRLLAEGKIDCSSFMVEVARSESVVSEEEETIRITSFIIHLFFLLYMRDHLKKL